MGALSQLGNPFFCVIGKNCYLKRKRGGGVMYSSDTPFQEDVMQVNVQGKNDCI